MHYESYQNYTIFIEKTRKFLELLMLHLYIAVMLPCNLNLMEEEAALFLSPSQDKSGNMRNESVNGSNYIFV